MLATRLVNVEIIEVYCENNQTTRTEKETKQHLLRRVDTSIVSLPRQILPGASYMVTRRCTQRQFLLLPTPTAKRVFAYCLALAQDATEVQIHAAAVLSNHYHLIVTDPHARLPDFVYILNKYVAKCMNAHHGRWENFWASGTQASYVRIADDQDLVAKIAYAVANPVEAALVSRSARWPGLLLWRPGRYRAKRPKVFFNQGGKTLNSLPLTITPPPLRECPRPRDVMLLVGRAIAEREKQLRQEIRQQGKSFLGVSRVLSQRHEAAPRSREPRREVSPRVAARDKWRRIELLQKLKQFIVEHKSALTRWIAGERDVPFPPGTYKLRVEYGVVCTDC